MDAFKIAIKFYLADASAVDSIPWIPIFHRWIQTRALAGHLLIDVADYAHVQGGPGTVLVSSEANIHIDRGENRPGLLYIRKLALAGHFPQRLQAVARDALRAADLLEREPTVIGKVKFRTDDIPIRLNDRLLSPNTPATLTAVEPDVKTLAKKLFNGTPCQFESTPGGDTLFEIRVKSNSTADTKTLLDRLT